MVPVVLTPFHKISFQIVIEKAVLYLAKESLNWKLLNLESHWIIFDFWNFLFSNSSLFPLYVWNEAGVAWCLKVHNSGKLLCVRKSYLQNVSKSIRPWVPKNHVEESAPLYFRGSKAISAMRVPLLRKKISGQQGFSNIFNSSTNNSELPKHFQTIEALLVAMVQTLD